MNYDHIRELISENKLNAALSLILKYLESEPNNSELWFLRGVVAIKRNQHELADKYLNKAIALSRKSEYLKYKGILKMNLHEFDEALNIFDSIMQEEHDVDSLVYAGCCGFLLEDPNSAKYISVALSKDRRKTKKMLEDFYTAFFESDPMISNSIKRLLKKKIEEL